MMKTFVVLITFFVLKAQAIPVPDPIPGLQAALQFCLTIEDDRVIPECVRLESSANWFTKEALPICRNQNFDDERVRCLSGIVDRHIRPEEVRVCESLTFDDEKARCLADIQRPFPYRTKLKIDPQPGLDAASRLCQSFFFDEDKRRCLRELTQAELYTVDAVKFCESRFSDDDKINCLSRLRNRFIVKEEVQLCSRVFTDEAQLTCLEQVQRKYQLRRSP